MALPSPPVKRALALDIGGTWTRAGLVRSDGTVIHSARLPTNSASSAETYVAAIVELLAQVSDGSGVEGIGVSVTGPVDPRTGRLFVPPNTEAFLVALPLGERLRVATGLRVEVDRDTNAALLAEHRFGAAQGSGEVVYLTVSTGVGGAVLTGGRLLRGSQGVAGELGHMGVDPSGPTCGCGRTGCLEAIVAGPALAAAATRAAQLDPRATRLRQLLAAAGSGGLDGVQVDQAAQAGDVVAQEILAGAGEVLASAVVDLVNLFNPEQVVIGGSVARAHPEWIRSASLRVVAEALAPANTATQVVSADLGDEGGLIGASLLVLGRTSSGSTHASG